MSHATRTGSPRAPAAMIEHPAFWIVVGVFFVALAAIVRKSL